jgi:hypothetical protein
MLLEFLALYLPPFHLAALGALSLPAALSTLLLALDVSTFNLAPLSVLSRTFGSRALLALDAGR